MTSSNISAAGSRFLRAKEAAAYFRISVSTLWQWSKERHDFPSPIRAGKKVTLWDVDAIEGFIRCADQERSR